jgi:DNA-binding response OmpR family regulator
VTLVLVIEDEPAIATLLRCELQTEGFEVTRASNGITVSDAR